MQTESDQFDATVRKVLSVSRDELKRREAEWKKQRANRKGGRKPKDSASASSRVDGAKD